MQDDENELDELIYIINNHNTQPHLPSLKCQPDGKKTLPPIDQKPKLNTTSTIAMPKYLVFKPWSGTDLSSEQYVTNEAIKEEIENQQEENHYEGDKQDYMQDSKLIGNPVNNSNEIGYFYKFLTGKVRLIKCLLDENGFKDCHFNNKNWTLQWSSSPFKMQTYRNLLPYQKLNHFPNSFHLTRKDLMNKTVSKMQVKYGITHYGFLPKTYILPQQLDQLLAQYNKHPQTYIVKPHNRSQGKGISVTSSIETIYSKLQKYSSLIVSHYIGNPLLINRLKFDLRIYVAITSINPLRIYVYQEGLARFATEQYDYTAQDSQNKKYQHLTNYSVNKKNTQYIASNNQNEEYYGSKWSLSAMKDFLNFNIGKNQTSELFDRIDEVIVKTIISAENLMYTTFQNNVPYINGCFEVLGFDIMIDSNLKPWLIEVNHSPSMNTDSTLDLKIKGNMIADLFTMAGITPLSQRYLDGGHSKFESRHYFNVDDKRSSQGIIDKFILKQIDTQYERRGGWRRAFPTLRNLKYKAYFETDRHFNKLLRQNLLKSEPLPNSTVQSQHQNRGYINQYRSNTVNKSSSLPQNNNNSKAPIIRFQKPKRTIVRGSSKKISDLSLY